MTHRIYTIEEELLNLLEKGPIKKPLLIHHVSRKTSSTIQGVYKSLRSLREREVITTQKGVVTLTLAWIEKQTQKFAEISRIYQAPSILSFFHELKSGDYVSFKFSSLRELDIFWVHSFFLFQSHTPKSIPILSLAPHDWFFSRPEADNAWVKRVKEKGHYQGSVITHATSLDKSAARKRIKEGVEILLSKNPLKQDERTYFNIVGPWIFEAKLDKKINQKLISLFQTTKLLNEDSMSELEKIINTKSINHLKIYHAPDLAKSYIKKLKKYFTFKLPMDYEKIIK